MKSFDGIWTAIVTPFDNNGEIDWDAFANLLEMQLEAKVIGVVVCGTTGESPTLSVQEKLSLFKKAKTILAGKAQLMAGTGSNNTQQSAELSKLAMDAGADSLLIVNPYYNKPTIAGLTAHYKAIRDAASLPICLYHIPSRTGLHVPSNEMATLINELKIEMVKESCGSALYFSELKNFTNTTMLSGDDPMFLPTLSVGGQGLVSVITNIFPKAMVRLYDAFMSKDMMTAQKIHHAVYDFIKALFIEANPAPAKLVLTHMGICKNNLRLPLVPVSEENAQAVIDSYQTTAKRLTEFS